MKVAVLNRQRAAHPGGDLTQIDATIEALGALGITAEYAPEGWTLDWLRGFDLAHIFHCNFGWSLYNYKRCKDAGMQYVITPIFYPDTTLGATRSEIREMLSWSARVLPHSRWERAEISRTIGGDLPFHDELIPNGTGSEFYWYDGQGSRLVSALLQIAPREGVLCVTARPGDKNSSVVELVCGGLGVPYRCATGLSRGELIAAYRAARVFVNASDSERMSLTIGEALCAGCRVVATDMNRGNEWYGPGLVTTKIGNLALSKAIRNAHEAQDNEWDYSPNRLARQITWGRVARMLVRVYEECV